MIAAHVGSGRTRRRAIALGMVLALGVSALDAVAGPLRDGAMHHESNVEAASHRSILGAKHDHQGSLESGTLAEAGTRPQAVATAQSGQTDHEHPGGDDHCAHVHGVALVPTVSLTLTAIVVDVRMIVAAHHDDPSTTSVRHPPRA